jgi:lactoylglutathione lyase
MTVRPGDAELVYTGIRVRDLDRARRFYTEGFGLRSLRHGRMEAGGVWEELEDPASHRLLELNFYPGAPPFREGDELDHLGFRVRDLEGHLAHLTRLGASIRIPPFGPPGQRLAFVADPDGIWIELYEEVSGDLPPSSQTVE